MGIKNGKPAPRVLMILPCFNEAGAIENVLREIDALEAAYDTVVIDDGSADATFAIASKLSPTVRLPDNLGIGGAVHTGIRYAHQRGYDFCVQVDGDGQHPPEEVAVLLDAYRERAVNITIGSRYLQNDTFRSTFARRLGSRVIGGWIGMLFGQKVTDPTSGLRLMDREAIDFFSKAYPHDYPEPISLAWALRHGLTAREVAVKMRERPSGISSITGFKTIFYMIRVMSYVALARLEKSRPGGERKER